MKFYGGNKKRILKKYIFHSFDGVSYSWDTGLFRLKILASLKPGDIFFIPYTKVWGTISKVTPVKYQLQNYTGHPIGPDEEDQYSRKIKGWWIGEVIIEVLSPDGKVFWVYDIEHWNAFGKSDKRRDTEDEDLDYRWDPVPHDPEMVIKFNRQVGLPDDYDLPPDWQRWY